MKQIPYRIEIVTERETISSTTANWDLDDLIGYLIARTRVKNPRSHYTVYFYYQSKLNQLPDDDADSIED
jgi:hypothetical protein